MVRTPVSGLAKNSIKKPKGLRAYFRLSLNRKKVRKPSCPKEGECLKETVQGCEWVGTPAELLKKVTPHGIERNATPQSIGKLLTGRSKLPVDQVTFQGNKNSNRTYLINLREEE